jgi:hypothetical protein
VNIFDAWKAAETWFKSGYGDPPDFSDMTDRTVFAGVLDQVLEEQLAGEAGGVASMFEDAARRLKEGDASPLDRVEGDDANSDLLDRLDRVNAAIMQLQREVQELRRMQ